MAVYIRQSPPREGVRGGREDFKWDSLTTSQDYDYYLGASMKIGLYSRGGKFVKHDWWTKQRGGTAPDDLDEETQRVKNFENELMGEALGQKPKNLLVGNPYEDRHGGEDSRGGRLAAGEVDEERAKRKKQKKEKKKEKKRRRDKKRMKGSRRRSTSSSSSSSASSSSSSPRRKRSPGRRERRDRETPCGSFGMRVKTEASHTDRKSRVEPAGNAPFCNSTRRRGSPDMVERRHRDSGSARMGDRLRGDRDARRQSDFRSKEALSPDGARSRDRRRAERDRSSSLSEHRHRRGSTDRYSTGRYRPRSPKRETRNESGPRRAAGSPPGRRESQAQCVREYDEPRRAAGRDFREQTCQSRRDRHFDDRMKTSGVRDRDEDDSDSRGRKRRR
uniref:Multiple myeloma tumor-associated protein 2-like N-terminal domain-containing protein n=1 Tax=Neospora caninum (strain Liverpool) TaxID=572307 RepID=A0A0F7U9W9_NEOCL|nr:TPA: hypothetical protein BN1204_010480 [Neospora caninum Liverpool]